MKVLVVGAGISGATLAERFATVCQAEVDVLEKRDHIGGNCADYLSDDGILVSRYGAHLFHTNYEDVWQYLQQFSGWRSYEHRVLSRVHDKLVPVPVNITTVNRLFNLSISSTKEMQAWLSQERLAIECPVNSEESALSRVGPRLYELMFKNYTHKQWSMWPAELEASVLDRIPVRDNWDDRYFSDRYQALPIEGYTRLFEKMLQNPRIRVHLDSDFFEVRDQFQDYDYLFYTGPIDRYFLCDSKVENILQYRSIRFEFERHPVEYYQEAAVVNYPNLDVDFTRIVEYKRFSDVKCPSTVVSREYTMWDGEPYYPVPSQKNQEQYLALQKEAEKLSTVHFVGRLANYKYFNMDQAFKNALDLFYRLVPVGQGR